jgi:GxxExxY protein
MNADKSGLIEEEITEKVIGAFFSVYNELGQGFLEQVYENALAQLLRDDGIEVKQQVGIAVYFRGKVVGEYRADLLVPGHVLIEVKAASSLAPGHEAQLINYLKATGIPVGLLLNFGPKPQFRRRIHSERSIRTYPPSSAQIRGQNECSIKS